MTPLRHWLWALLAAIVLTACSRSPVEPTADPAAPRRATLASDSRLLPDQPTSFEKQIAPAAKQRCGRCHQNAMANWATVSRHVRPGEPEASYYLRHGSNADQSHTGKDAWGVDGPAVAAWIAAGAPQ